MGRQAQEAGGTGVGAADKVALPVAPAVGIATVGELILEAEQMVLWGGDSGHAAACLAAAHMATQTLDGTRGVWSAHTATEQKSRHV